MTGSVSWADVLAHLEEVRSLTAESETVELSEGERPLVTERAMVYFRDPGLFRHEIFPVSTGGAEGARPASSAEAETITIVVAEPGRARQLMLYPARQWAHSLNHTFRGTARESQPKINHVAESWRRLTGLAASATRELGESEIEGVRLVGFEAPIEKLMVQPSAPMKHGIVRVWVTPQTAVPARLELEYRNESNVPIRTTVTAIGWNVPLPDKLFELTVPEGWRARRTAREVVGYHRTVLASHVTLWIGAESGPPLVTEAEVVRAAAGEYFEELDADIPPHLTVDFELIAEARERLRDFAVHHPDEIIMAELGGEPRSVLDLRQAGPETVRIDLSRLGRNLAQFEAEYLTTDKEQR